MSIRTLARGVLIALAVAAPIGSAAAQTASGIPNALQGFSTNRDKPIHIKATTLEVRDKDKRAIFIGNVHVVQGDTTMKCKTLEVFYDQEGAPGDAKAAQPGPGGQQQIRRLEAKGGVVVTQKDQTATGDTGIFEMRENKVTLAGGVVVTQGPNVLRGDRLTVDLTSGFSRVESDKPGEGRVEGLFLTHSRPKPGDAKPGEAKGVDSGEAKSGDAKPEASRAREAPKPATKSAPGQPLKLN
jgi:lipopolysaccharide export system protein LptA